MTTDTKVEELQNFIGGKFVPATGKEVLDILKPADGTVIGKVRSSTKDDVAKAVEAASKAYETWGKWTVKKRMAPLLKLNQLLKDREEMLAKIIMEEHGKTYKESIGSIRKGNDTVEYACGMPNIIRGRVLEVSNGVKCEEHRQPHGVVASIVPFNFPIMVPLWTLPIAVACGNTYILKPSEKVPKTANAMMSLIKEAGFPDGVLNLVNGTKECVEALCDHKDIKAVAFVGSSKVAQIVSKRCRAVGKRVLALGGAKNHLVAVQDCDLDMTSSDVVASFCGCAGQRCMAAANLLTVGDNQKLLDAVVKKAAALKPGQGDGQMGPLIDQMAVDKCNRYVEESVKKIRC
eukprot:UN31329